MKAQRASAAAAKQSGGGGGQVVGAWHDGWLALANQG